MKECANCCEYLLNDMQIENILDKYELRQDRTTKDKQMREAVQRTLDIKYDSQNMRRMKLPFYNVKLS